MPSPFRTTPLLQWSPITSGATDDPYLSGHRAVSGSGTSKGSTSYRIHLVPFPAESGSCPMGACPSALERLLQRRGYVLAGLKEFNEQPSTSLKTRCRLPPCFSRQMARTVSGTSVLLDASCNFSKNAAHTSKNRASKVEFALTGGPYSKTIIGRATLSTFGNHVSWDATSVPNGTYRLQSVVTDGAGRTNYSPAITVKVDNEK